MRGFLDASPIISELDGLAEVALGAIPKAQSESRADLKET